VGLHVDGQLVCIVQSALLPHLQEVKLKALGGAVKEATIGIPITAARPIFLMTSRLVEPLKLAFKLFAKRFFSLNWSIASQTKSSGTAFPESSPTNLVISATEFLPLQDFQTNAAV
jgi:hypothetical protein